LLFVDVIRVPSGISCGLIVYVPGPPEVSGPNATIPFIIAGLLSIILSSVVYVPPYVKVIPRKILPDFISVTVNVVDITPPVPHTKMTSVLDFGTQQFVVLTRLVNTA
jgi:hypothetical protein